VIPDKASEGSLTARAYHVGSFVLTLCSLNYLATPFLVLSLEKAHVYWSYWYYAPHFIALALYLAVPVLFKVRPAVPRRPARRRAAA
jgi:hypothetical protein